MSFGNETLQQQRHMEEIQTGTENEELQNQPAPEPVPAAVQAQGQFQEFHHIIPMQVERENELLTKELLEQEKRFGSVRLAAAKGEPQQKVDQAKEGIKEARERRRKEDHARQNHCFRHTAAAYDLRSIADAYRKSREAQEGQDPPGGAAEQGNRFDDLKTRVMNDRIDTRIFGVSSLSLDYIRRNIGNYLAMRDRFEELRQQREQIGQLPAEEQEQIGEHIRLFDAFWGHFRLLAGDYGVDVNTGEYLREQIKETPEETRDRINTVAAYLKRREEIKEQAKREKEAESKKNEIVQLGDGEIKNETGTCSYHKYMSKEDAEAAVKSSDGYLYAQKAGPDLYELRATLPKSVELKQANGESKQVPLRRVYNQFVKMLIAPLCRVENGKRFLKDRNAKVSIGTVESQGADNASTLTAEDYCLDVEYAVRDAIPGNEAWEVLEKLIRPQLPEEEANEFLNNLALIIQNNGDQFLGKELAEAFSGSALKIFKAKEEEGTLAERIKAIEERKDLNSDKNPDINPGKNPNEKEHLIRAARNVHEAARAAEEEWMGILDTEDDDPDVPLPNMCSSSADFLSRMRQNMSGQPEPGTVDYALRTELYEHQLQCAQLCLTHPELFLNKTDIMNKAFKTLLSQVIARVEETTIDGRDQEKREQAKSDHEMLTSCYVQFRENDVKKPDEWKKNLQSVLNRFEKSADVEKFFDRNDVERIIQTAEDYTTYDYHRAVKLGQTKDGKTITSECFAAETMQYVKSPFTRGHKAIGIYNGGEEMFRRYYVEDGMLKDSIDPKEVRAYKDASEKQVLPGEEYLKEQKEKAQQAQEQQAGQTQEQQVGQTQEQAGQPV